MKKKNISFILWGIAAVNLLSIVVNTFIFPEIYENLGVPQTPVMDRIIFIVSVVTFCVLIIVGIILRIVFRNEE